MVSKPIHMKSIKPYLNLRFLKALGNQWTMTTLVGLLAPFFAIRTRLFNKFEGLKLSSHYSLLQLWQHRIWWCWTCTMKWTPQLLSSLSVILCTHTQERILGMKSIFGTIWSCDFHISTFYWGGGDFIRIDKVLNLF